MKRILLLLSVVVLFLNISAAPVKRTGWKSIRLTDGTTIKAVLQGDEFMHYMVDVKDRKYKFDDTSKAFIPIDYGKVKKHADAKRARAMLKRQTRTRAALGEYRKPYIGNKKVLMLLVQFTDMKFDTKHTIDLYQQIANEPQFMSQEGFKGSVHDYFFDQSRQQLNLTFDVKGPIQLAHNYAYYGKNDIYDNDVKPEEMVVEACRAVDSEINFSDYDWDGDGIVDAVYVLYAGQGENTTASYDPNTIWPHQGELSSINAQITLDGVTIDPYACGPELSSPTKIDGIGAICHELSHCFGLADMYDTVNNTNFGMSTWDLMDYGLYNGDSFVPAGYTSFERAYCGWMSPIELSKDTTITSMKSLCEGGDAYIYHNDHAPQEYYLLENRRKNGWDASLDGEGLLVLHVDFDQNAWTNNEVNSVATHQRCTIFHADNSDQWITMAGYMDVAGLAGDPYPYGNNDSLTTTSMPSASLYNINSVGTYHMNKGLTSIARHDDGTISFAFKHQIDATGPIPSGNEDGILFHESFDKCSGTGGNDGVFSGSVASSTTAFVPDSAGWSSPSNKMFGGDRCAKFGTSSYNGTVYSPPFNTTGKDTLVFVAAPFGTDGNTIDVYVNDKILGTYQLAYNSWTTVTIPFNGNGLSKIQFIPSKRFFLDDVKVFGPKILSDIQRVHLVIPNKLKQPIYNLAGQLVGNDLKSLPKGLYIQGRNKVVK